MPAETAAPKDSNETTTNPTANAEAQTTEEPKAPEPTTRPDTRDQGTTPHIPRPREPTHYGSSQDHKKPRLQPSNATPPPPAAQNPLHPDKRPGETLPGGASTTTKKDHTVPGEQPPSKKGRTIAIAKTVVTKRGKVIDVQTNEGDDIDYDLLKNYDFPATKLKEGMDKEMASLREFEVFEEITTDKWDLPAK